MTVPRQVIPDRCYLVTRRVSERRFLLRPSTLVNQVVLYCLARAATGYGIQLHAVQVLSNHVHLVLTDLCGNLPDFMAWFDREVAKCLNQHYRRSENFWSSDKYSAVLLTDAEAVVAKLVYLFTNVVSAFLVRDFREWTGVRSTPDDWLDTREQTVARPALRFNQDDQVHATANYRFTIPSMLADRDPMQLVQDIHHAVSGRQCAVRAETERTGRHFLGVRRSEKVSPFDAPTTGQSTGKHSPRFAAGTPEGLVLARRRYRVFLDAYRAARALFLSGCDVLFPYGTFGLVRVAAVACAPPDTA